MQMTGTERTKTVQDVHEMLNAYFAAIHSEGLNAEFRYLDRSDAFFWVPPGYRTHISYDSVAVILRSRGPAFRSIASAWDTLRVEPVTTEFAVYTGTLGSVSHYGGVETGTAIKRADGWRLLNGQTSVWKEDVGSRE